MTEVARGLTGEQCIRYGDEVIRFRVRVQPDRRLPRVAIHVEPDGTVLVDAPSTATSASVLAAVRKRSLWISRHVEAARERHGGLQGREYVSGESLLYLGRRYRLKVAVQPTAPAHAALGDHVLHRQRLLVGHLYPSFRGRPGIAVVRRRSD